VGELITVREYWGNHYAGTSKLGKVYRDGRLIVCEPYSFESEEADGKDTCDFGAGSYEQE
jgi:hypothetical protein